MKAIAYLLVYLIALIHKPLSAEEEYTHFPSLEAPTIEVALCNLAKFNEKLAAITNKETLTATDMASVHEITYTLENAIMRLQKDLEKIAIDLEEVHKASERLDSNTLKNSGDNYLAMSQLLLSSPSCP